MIKVKIMSLLVRYTYRIGKVTAIVSFLIATILFLSIPFFSDEYSLWVSFYIVIAVILLNLLVGMAAIICSISYPFVQRKFIKVISLLLLNIPVAICYGKLLPYTMG